MIDSLTSDELRDIIGRHIAQDGSQAELISRQQAHIDEARAHLGAALKLGRPDGNWLIWDLIEHHVRAAWKELGGVE